MNRIYNNPPHGGGKPLQVNINPGELPDVRCECGCGIFLPVKRLKKMSELISPDGRSKYLWIDTVICYECHKDLPENP